MNTARLSGCEVSPYGEYQPTLTDRLLAHPWLLGLFAAALICGAAVLVEVWL